MSLMELDILGNYLLLTHIAKLPLFKVMTGEPKGEQEYYLCC